MEQNIKSGHKPKLKTNFTFSHYMCFDKCPSKELLPTLIYEKKEKAAYSAANSSSSLTLALTFMKVSGVMRSSITWFFLKP